MFLFDSKSRRRTIFFHYFGEYLLKISQTLFITSLLTFFSYLVLEDFKTGLISNYFDLNILLILALASGALTVLFSRERLANTSGAKRYLWAEIFAILIGAIAWRYFKVLDGFSLSVSLSVAVAVFIIIVLFYDYRGKN